MSFTVALHLCFSPFTMKFITPGPDTMWKESVLPPSSVIAGEPRRPGDADLSPTRVFISWAHVLKFYYQSANLLFSCKRPKPKLYTEEQELQILDLGLVPWIIAFSSYVSHFQFESVSRSCGLITVDWSKLKYKCIQSVNSLLSCAEWIHKFPCFPNREPYVRNQ